MVLAGCGDGLIVSGEVFVIAEGTRSGFVFSEPTGITDLLHESAGGGMAGTCAIDTSSIDGAPSVSLQAPDEVTDVARLNQFRALESPVTGLCSSVRAGAVEYGACPGSGCSFRHVIDDPVERSVEVDIDCEYQTLDGRSAFVTAQLRFTGCTVD